MRLTPQIRKHQTDGLAFQFRDLWRVRAVCNGRPAQIRLSLWLLSTVCPLGSNSRLGNPLAADLVEKVDDDIIFLDAEPVEVFPHIVRQLVFALPPKILSSRHGRRVQSYAPRSR